LDQAKTPHKSSSATLWKQIKDTLQSIKSLGGFREIQISFKTISSSKEALSKSSQASFIYTWSLQRTKLCWIKHKRPIRVLQQHFEDKSKVLFKASNHQRIPRDTNFLQDKLFKQRSSLSLSLQARKLSLKEFSSLLHLRLKSTKNEALLDQAKTPHKSSSATLWRQIKGTLQSIKSPRDSGRYKFSSRQVLQARKLSQKFSSLLHRRLKSTKNEALLDQA